ncbi:hypothetical protein OROGR_027714 [Orobanche gracilis]
MSEDSAPPAPALDCLTISDPIPEAQFSQRVPIRSIIGRPDKGAGLAGRKARVGGLVKSGRLAEKGTLAFLDVNDGSCLGILQVVVKEDIYNIGDLVATGTSVHVEGLLKSPPESARSRALSCMCIRLFMLVLSMLLSIRYPKARAKTRKYHLKDL